jgi:hypothetical protein
MTNDNKLEVPAEMVKSPLDEVIFILSRARIDLEARGYEPADIGTAFISIGVNALSDARGDRETGRELYMLAMNFGARADAVESHPKH